jgi:nitrogen fixation protein FixH
MKLSWGTKIAMLYGGFVALILVLVVGSMRQHFDLVSNSYYADEINYQKVIDANKNQSTLSAPISIHANEQQVMIEFPTELSGKNLSGNVQFYSPVNSEWDKNLNIETIDNKMIIPRSTLRKTKYDIKIDLIVSGKNYHHESAINLYQ